MKVKDIVIEDFINYKKPSMFVLFPYCTFKCDKECGEQICQNSSLVNLPTIDIPINRIVELYMNNTITESIVCGGLEPFDSWDDLEELVSALRKVTDDDIVIYTGYNEFENSDFYSHIETLSCLYKNIIIKYGRFIPDQPPHFDEVLGINLSSDNQHAVKIS